ncbi:ent-kaurene oxidase [Nemania abortiva]|nr:ent-kaurene oxidase [Nemania abortiva]
MIFFLMGILLQYISHPRYPDEIPDVGYGRGFLGYLKNNIGYFIYQRKWILEGYQKYSKNGLPFLAPGGMFRPYDVVLPQSMLSWLFEQPESVVDAITAHNVNMFGRFNFLDPAVAKHNFGPRAVHKSLSRNLAELLPAVDDEIQHAIKKKTANVSEAWETISLWDLWLDIVGPAANIALTGPDACRDKEFLRAIFNFNHVIFRNIIFLRMFPAFLHPLLGRLATISNWLYWRKAYKILGPIIKLRIDQMQRRAGGEGESNEWTPPNDLITWLIRLIQEEHPTAELDPVMISKHMLPVELAAVDTTVVTGTLWIQDLLKSPTAINDLVEELSAHQPAAGKRWSKEALLSLSRVDSSIRESQRLSNFHLTLIERAVIPTGGVRLPELGWMIPQGAQLTVNLDGSHHDSDVYDNPESYDAFRFSRERSTHGDNGKYDRNKPDRLGMVTMNDRHFAFGHGKHQW